MVKKVIKRRSQQESTIEEGDEGFPISVSRDSAKSASELDDGESSLSDEELIGEDIAMDIDNIQIGHLSAVEQEDKTSSSAEAQSKVNSNDNEVTVKTKPLNCNERMVLLNEIERLKLVVFDATVKGIGSPSGSVLANNVDEATRKLEAARKSFKLLFEENTLVPVETPFFQWKGNVFNKRKPVFANVEACLYHFERVLEAHRLNVNENWQRLVPARLSSIMTKWYTQHIEGLGYMTWTDFKVAIISKYGRNQADVRDEARERLEKI
ncbi:hypothetical protein, partial, partial [Parasitella parasitica]